MSLTNRENFLRNASLEGHEWIPQHVNLSQAYWHEAREDLEDICLRHPVLFPDFEKGKTDFDSGIRSEDQRREVDAWGCEWEYRLDGLLGLVTGHPLADWANLETWKPPEPPVFDAQKRRELAEKRARDEIISCDSEHGFLFMRLYYLRGFDNFMMDVASQDPRLDRLVEIVAGYWERVFRPHIEAGIDLLSTADDLGTQTASMLGPDHFRRWLLPTYKRLFLPARTPATAGSVAGGPARRAGAHVFMHHDGYIMDIMDEIIESGVSIVNPQDLVNGIDNIAREVKGRVCIRIDIDRQQVLPFGSPGDVRELVKEEVMKLGSPAGGLEMVVGIYPPTSLENAEALFSALEEYRTYWVRR